MRRWNGKQFLGNTKPTSMEVHDLDNEKGDCQIDEIKSPKFFTPDTLDQAHSEGFDNCAKCIGGSTR